MTIKESLRKAITDNRDTLEEGTPLQLSFSGTSPAYVKLAVYQVAKELKLSLTCSVKEGYVELKKRQVEVRQIQVAASADAAPTDDRDVDLDEIFHVSD